MPIGVTLAAVAIATAPIPAATWANAHESAGRWESALDLYLQLHESHRASVPDLSARIHRCVRHAAQFQRHRDPAFQRYVLSLTLADALAVYQDVIEKVSRQYADANRATPARLFEHGKDEFTRSLGDPGYLAKHIPGLDPARANAIRVTLTSVRVAPNAGPRDVRVAVRDVATGVREIVPAADPAAIVLEFLCGACAGLDEYSTFQPPTPMPTPTPAATVSGATILDERFGIGYLRVSEFHQSTVMEFDAAVEQLRMRGMRALVIDFRGNPGGLLTAGIDLGRRLIPAGVIVQTTGQDPAVANRTFTSESGMAAFDLPLVLLVDAGTMSAAEMVAAAVKDNARGVLVGTPTFGKGTVQAPVKLNDGEKANRSGVVIVTVARTTSPNGRPIGGAGVVPDIIERDPEAQLKSAVSQATAMSSSGRPMTNMP